MNIPLLYFYLNAGPNDTGLYLQDILSWQALDAWEDCQAHHIQWLFPLPEPSAFNPNAPLMDEETIDAFRKIPHIEDNIESAYEMAARFLFKGEPFWVQPRNHNQLRITRMIRFFNLVDMTYLADYTYYEAMEASDKNPGVISQITLNFWEEALKERKLNA